MMRSAGWRVLRVGEHEDQQLVTDRIWSVAGAPGAPHSWASKQLGHAQRTNLVKYALQQTWRVATAENHLTVQKSVCGLA